MGGQSAALEIGEKRSGHLQPRSTADAHARWAEFLPPEMSIVRLPSLQHLILYPDRSTLDPHHWPCMHSLYGHFRLIDGIAYNQDDGDDLGDYQHTSATMSSTPERR